MSEVKLPDAIHAAILRDQLAHTAVGREAAERFHGFRTAIGIGSQVVEQSLATNAALRRAIAAALLRAEADGMMAGRHPTTAEEAMLMRQDADALEREDANG